MTSSGTYTYAPNLADIMDEVLENAGVSPEVSGTAHIKSFARSLRLMLNSEWATIGIRNWMVTEESIATTVGGTQFPLPAGGIDIVEAVLRRAGSGIGSPSDVEMYALTRNEWLTIVNKQDQGRPDRFWVDRQVAPLVNYWQCGSNTTDMIVYTMLRQNQDVTGDLTATLGIPTMAYNALVAGMSARMALKWNPQKWQMLQGIYLGPQMDIQNPGGALGALRNEDRERGDIDLYAAFEPRTGRR